MKNRRWYRQGAVYIFAALSLIFGIVLLIIASVIPKSLLSQYEAERWQQDEMCFSQISCFVSEDENVTGETITALRHAIDDRVAADTPEIENSGNVSRLWIDAYSGETSVGVSVGKETIPVRAIFTGGDFFMFNPVRMMSGWYYGGSDIMDDTVVLNRSLAWKLYGGYDLAGMEIYINGHPCVIAGVADEQPVKAERETIGEDMLLYMPYTLMQRVGAAGVVTCYEAVLPDPVKGLALKTFSESLTFSDGNYEIVENTGRFSILALAKYIGKIP